MSSILDALEGILSCQPSRYSDGDEDATVTAIADVTRECNQAANPFRLYYSPRTKKTPCKPPPSCATVPSRR